MFEVSQVLSIALFISIFTEPDGGKALTRHMSITDNLLVAAAASWAITFLLFIFK